MTEISDSWQDERAVSPSGFKRKIAALEMSIAGAARFLGISERTALRYAHGDVDIPTTTVLLFNLMLAANLKPHVPKRNKRR